MVNDENLKREIIKVDRELIENISNLIDIQASNDLIAILTDLHPADIAELINHLSLRDASYVFKLLDTETAGEVITEIDENLRDKIVADLDTETLSDIVDELETDDATDIVSNLPETLAEEVLEKIDKEDSDDVKELMKYPEDSAGGIMSSDFVYVHSDSTIKDAIKEVRNNADDFDHIYHIYILEHDDTLVGILSLKHLLITPLKAKIADVMKEDLIYVSPYTDQEEVAELMEKYDLVAVPVVNDTKQMVGRITVDDVIDVIHEEASEDLHKTAGLSDDQESSDSVFRISRIRLPWLIVALIMEFGSAKLLSSNEQFIKQYYIATFFLPILMAMGGSSGSQAAIVMVKAIGTKSVWLKENFRYLIKEFFVSLLNGVILGSILMIGTQVAFPGEEVTLHFSFLLSISLTFIILFATMVGATVPLVLKLFGLDPAMATGPFVTTSNDIFGILIYFSILTLFLI